MNFEKFKMEKIDEIVENIYGQMRAENEEFKKAIIKESKLSCIDQTIEQRLSEKELDKYYKRNDVAYEIQGLIQRNRYLQGLKDCVSILRFFDMLK